MASQDDDRHDDPHEEHDCSLLAEGGVHPSDAPPASSGTPRWPARRSRRSARPGSSSRAASARRRPPATSSARRTSSSSTRRRALASAAASPTGASRASTPSVATLRWPSRSEATRAQPDAMASSSTMPKDSPRTDGEQYTVQPRMRAARSSSLMRPSHSMRPSWPKRWRSSSDCGPSPPTQTCTSGGQLRQRGEEHLEALAGLVPAEEEDRGPGRGMRRPLGEPLDLDPVVEELVLPAEGALGEGHRVR